MQTVNRGKVSAGRVVIQAELRKEFGIKDGDDVVFGRTEHGIEVKTLGCDFYQFLAYYGFKEDPDVPELLEESGRKGFPFDMMETSFFVSRETLIPTVSPGMAMWRERLFASMSKNAVKASEFFQIPTNRVVELGTQVEL